MDSVGQKHMVFGDMLEMGSEAISSHVEIGHECVKAGIAFLYCLGADSVNTVETALKDGIHYAKHFDNKNNVAKAVKKQIKPEDIILFKGSRGVAVEEIISLIKDI
jgi:UDP-N-acetylmuramoyl-tripeptide--D-alanyl-D-alanine ligase